MDGFIRFDGIAGESSDRDHRFWADLETVEWGASKPVESGAVGVARRRADTKVREVAVTKVLDASSPKLFEAVANGKVFKRVDIDLTTAGDGRMPFLRFELDNVHITSMESRGQAQSEQLPVDELVLNFEKIKYTYFEWDVNMTRKGVVETTWNVPTATSS